MGPRRLLWWMGMVMLAQEPRHGFAWQRVALTQPARPRLGSTRTRASESDNLAATTLIAPGCLLVAPKHEYDHFRRESVVLLTDVGEDGVATGVLLDKPTAFAIDEMAPGLDAFAGNTLYMGGEDGGKTVIMVHRFGDLEGARPIGSGLYVGGVSAAKAAVAGGQLPAEGFRFFFNKLVFTTTQLAEMAGVGGWLAVDAPDTSSVVLNDHNGDLWNQLRRRFRTEVAAAEDRGRS